MFPMRSLAARQAPISCARRSFQSRTEFRQWMQRVEASAMPRPKGAVRATPAQATPFLVRVDPIAESRFQVWGVPKGQVVEHSPAASYREVLIPLSTDEAVRTAVSDLGSWSTFRLSKFYELTDVLTGDVAYRYAAGTPVEFVTAGHYHSRKIQRTDLGRDVSLRCYLTHVGRSSIEIRTDAVQDNQLVNMCHTVMVALDPVTMKPLSTTDTKLPSMQFDDDKQDWEGQRERAVLAEWHDIIRKKRAKSSMQLRTSISTPPTPTEVQDVHHLHQCAIRMREGASPRPMRPRTVGEHTFRSSFVIFPEDRNVHGKLFGGYVMSQAYNLALYAVKFFVRSGQKDAHGVVPLGIDEAVFHQPVSIGDMVTFTARVVHATEYTCRVFVTVQVFDPTDPDRLPARSNRLVFVFAVQPCVDWNNNDCHFVVPNTYSEVLMQVEATRRYAVEGPSDEEAQAILQDAAVAACVPHSRM